MELSRRNDERTWYMCFVADRSWAIQTGRQSMLQEDARFLQLDQWRLDPWAVAEDASIIALVYLRRIMVSLSARRSGSRLRRLQARFDSQSPFNSVSSCEDELDQWRDTWVAESTRSEWQGVCMSLFSQLISQSRSG
jgi:hypothetical protein